MKIDGDRWIWEGREEIRGEEECGDEEQGKSEALQRMGHHHARKRNRGSIDHNQLSVWLLPRESILALERNDSLRD